VFRARSGHEDTFTALSPEIVGANLHWNGERSVVCIGREDGCPYCPRKPLTEFYTLGYQESSQKVWIIAITNGALLWCHGYKQGLWCVGRRFTIGRSDAGGNARCWLTLGERVTYVDRLPTPHPLRECLSRMWGLPADAEPQEEEQPVEDKVRQIEEEIAAALDQEEMPL
jgi:hypothetical protein